MYIALKPIPYLFAIFEFFFLILSGVQNRHKLAILMDRLRTRGPLQRSWTESIKAVRIAMSVSTTGFIKNLSPFLLTFRIILKLNFSFLLYTSNLEISEFLISFIVPNLAIMRHLCQSVITC